MKITYHNSKGSSCLFVHNNPGFSFYTKKLFGFSQMINYKFQKFVSSEGELGQYNDC